MSEEHPFYLSCQEFSKWIDWQEKQDDIATEVFSRY